MWVLKRVVSRVQREREWMEEVMIDDISWRKSGGVSKRFLVGEGEGEGQSREAVIKRVVYKICTIESVDGKRVNEGGSEG